MIIYENRTDKTFNKELLEKIALYLCDRDIELILTSDEEIQEVNRMHRGINKATDVLSFPLEAVEGFPLGSIMISADSVVREAEILGHSADDELALLFTHGLLHLLGYDHEVDAGEMRQKEQEVMAHFLLGNSLIVRND